MWQPLRRWPFKGTLCDPEAGVGKGEGSGGVSVGSRGSVWRCLVAAAFTEIVDCVEKSYAGQQL